MGFDIKCRWIFLCLLTLDSINIECHNPILWEEGGGASAEDQEDTFMDY